MQRPREAVPVPDKRAARVAGVFYLLMALGTAFGMGYVDPLLPMSGDGAEAARVVQSHEALLLAGFASTSLGLVAMLFLANALFGLFKSVDRGQARLLVIFVVAGVSIALLNMAHLLAAIRLSRGDGFLSAIEPAHRIELMVTFLVAYKCGTHVATFFWGLWLLPFGMLLLRFGFAPRVLGVLMTIGCFAYLFLASASLFFPGYSDLARKSLVLPTLGELGTIAWLLTVGAKARRPDAA